MFSSVCTKLGLIPANGLNTSDWLGATVADANNETADIEIAVI
jgi:hypothetical protein